MLLISLLIISLFILSLIRFSPLNLLASVAEKTHHYCLSQLPQNSETLNELKALVCAENFNSLSSSQLYISSGLIHLFVVSGAHLILIENLLSLCSENLRPNKSQIFWILLLYAFACNLNAPVVRSLISYLITHSLNAKKIHWSPYFKLLITGLLCLCLNPLWISSLSLQMSWLAAFLVVCSSHFFTESSTLFKHSLFFFALLPTIIFFQIPSLSVILCNLIFAPILEFILFPLGLFTWFCNWSYPIFDKILFLFQYILSKCEIEIQAPTSDSPQAFKLYIWLFILSLHLVFHLLYVQKQRKKPL